MSIYVNDWTIEEAKDIGAKHRAVCMGNGGYEYALTEGKEYDIVISGRILPMSPLCDFDGDNGKGGSCHLERFKKIGEENA